MESSYGFWFYPIAYDRAHNLIHVIPTTLSEGWHKETSKFHMPIGVMTISLDDVSCLPHIPMEGEVLTHIEKISQDQGVEYMT